MGTAGGLGWPGAVACVLIAVLVVALPVGFGVAFPYAIAAAEFTVFALFAWFVWAMPLPLRHLIALLGLAAGFALQVVLLDGDLVSTVLRGSCEPAELRPRAMDTSAAIDSFRRVFAYAALFVVVRGLGASDRASRVLSGSLAVAAVVLLLLGIVAPQDTRNVLWFYTVPTYDHHWLSSSVNAFLTDFWAYDVVHSYRGLELHLDEFMISSQPVGPLFNSNHYAGAVGVALPVLLAFVARTIRVRGYAHWPVTLPLGLGGVALVYWLTDSQAGAAAAMLVSLAAFFYVGTRMERVGRCLAVVALLAVAATLAVPWLQTHRELVALGARPLVWLQTVQAFLERPLLGVGLGNFRELGLGFTDVWRPTRWYSPHNVYLHVLVGVGLIGVVWLAAVAAPLAPRVSGSRPPCGRHVAAGLCASLAFALAFAVVHYAPGLPFNAMLTAVVAGLLFAGGTTSIASKTRGRPALGRIAIQISLTALALGLALSSVHYAFSQVRTFRVLDLAASALSTDGYDERLRSALAEEVARNDRDCAVLPPRKDYLLGMAYAHLLLVGSHGDEHARRAVAYLDRNQSIGSRDAAVLQLRTRIGERDWEPVGDPDHRGPDDSEAGNLGAGG
jgi:hypothetical protein